MRPPGEIRRALRAAVQAEFAQRGQGATWRDLANRAGVGLLVARRTVENMVRTGDLRVCGQARMPHTRRPMTLYIPAPPPAVDTGPSLDALLRTWTRGPALEAAGG
jgi:hypothetical protein